MKSLIELIVEIARIPSFSSFEERIHPYIFKQLNSVTGAKHTLVGDRNIVASLPGNTRKSPIGLTAHLDKINHFEETPPSELPTEYGLSTIKGQLDDSVGLGILLHLAGSAEYNDWPPLYLLMSEMEESFGLKHHHELLRSGGEGLYNGMGADKISDHLINNGIDLQSVITIDTTPIFRGDQGVALYTGHWEYTKTEPSAEEAQATSLLKEQMLKIDPGLYLSNNTNDYLTYGKRLNKHFEYPVPSIALEPAIHPYHQKDEQVYVADIHRTVTILKEYLNNYA